MTTNAASKRQEAIGMISELYMPADKNYNLTFRHCGGWGSNVIGMADNVRKLAQLGRTARWQAAIDRWANMILQSSGNPKSLEWAFLQGMVYAGHASE